MTIRRMIRKRRRQATSWILTWPSWTAASLWGCPSARSAIQWKCKNPSNSRWDSWESLRTTEWWLLAPALSLIQILSFIRLPWLHVDISICPRIPSIHRQNWARHCNVSSQALCFDSTRPKMFAGQYNLEEYVGKGGVCSSWTTKSRLLIIVKKRHTPDTLVHCSLSTLSVFDAEILLLKNSIHFVCNVVCGLLFTVQPSVSSLKCSVQCVLYSVQWSPLISVARRKEERLQEIGAQSPERET